MISREHRESAASVAFDGTAPESSDRGLQKAYTYGVTAKALSRLALPTASEVLGGRRPGNVSTVTDILKKNLKVRVDELLKDDPGLHDELDRAFRARMSTIHEFYLNDSGQENLYAGINTAMDVEEATLSTVRMLTFSGEQISRDGLLKSQRVPFAFAMQSLANLDLSTGNVLQWVDLPHAHRAGDVTLERTFKPDMVRLSKTQGLSLIKDLPPAKDHSKFAGEPAIGCPATLVKHFVRDLHAVAAEACVESGIIPTTEE